MNNAINKIRQAYRRLIGDEPANRYKYLEPKPSGTVEEAWHEVGEILSDIMPESENK